MGKSGSSRPSAPFSSMKSSAKVGRDKAGKC